jgi:hypothetical protein
MTMMTMMTMMTTMTTTMMKTTTMMTMAAMVILALLMPVMRKWLLVTLNVVFVTFDHPDMGSYRGSASLSLVPLPHCRLLPNVHPSPFRLSIV